MIVPLHALKERRPNERGRAVRRIATICIAVIACLTVGAVTLQAATGSWVRIQHPALKGGGSVVYIRDILGPSAGNPWLAVGYLVDSEGTRVPSAWTSSDGVGWSRATMAPSTSAERRDGPYLVARLGSTAVAIGDRFEGELRTAAWFTSAPNVWTAVTSPNDPLVTYRGRITALAAGPAEFVAVGVDYTFGRSNVTVFTSADGRSWKFRGGIETSDGFAPFGVSEANGRIVLVGATSFDSGADGRIWVLGEGATWTRIPSAPLGLDGPGTQVITSVAWNVVRGFVAGGSVVRGGHEIPTLWWSSDGLTWTTLPNGTPPNDGRNAAIQRIVSVGNGFVAAGASDAGARIWRSADGTSWTTVSPPATSAADAILVFVATDGEKLVLVTLSEFGSRIHRRSGSAWTRADTGSAFPKPTSATELVAVAARGSQIVAVGANDGQPLVMTSDGGTAWQRRAFGDRAGRLLAIAADRDRFWAAGWRLVKGRASMAVWTSTNGRRWQRYGGTALDPVGAFVDLAPVRGGFVAVALEPSKRGFVTTAWRLTRAAWRDEGVLGPGEPRAVCAGPHGVTAVAVRGSGLQSSVVAWTRTLSGRWPREPELVASTGASAVGCADAPSGTVVVGQDGRLAAALWSRVRPGDVWRGVVLAQTDPASSFGAVVREGSGFLATGAFGGRGQVDLAVWHSVDGVGWGWLGGVDPVFTESGYQAGQGIVRVGDRIVVVGRHGAGSAGLWVGPVLPTGANEPGPSPISGVRE
jgi:hypothetical protein